LSSSAITVVLGVSLYTSLSGAPFRPLGWRGGDPEQGWGKIRPIRIRIRIREYSANSNFENDGKIRRIRIRIST
jgi:hypothetical protein